MIELAQKISQNPKRLHAVVITATASTHLQQHHKLAIDSFLCLLEQGVED
jgi:hypothetical protein